MSDSGRFEKTVVGDFKQSLAPPDFDSKVLSIITPANAQTLIRFRLNYNVYLFNNTEERYAKYFLADLKGTDVNPGQQFTTADGKSIKGWFTSGVDIEMRFAENNHDIQLLDDSPKTTALQGTATSSITQDLGFGVFGTDVTGSVNESITNSFSYDVSGFESENNSDTTILRHAMPMTACKGGIYTKPQDLYDMNLLHDPPDRAIANISLPSQGLWLAQAGTNGGLVERPIDATVAFSVSITHELTWCQLTLISGPNVGFAKYATQKYTKTFSSDIDFSVI